MTWLAAKHGTDPIELAMVEVEAAIAMVVAGAAVRIRLCNLAGAADVAFDGAARAQAAGVAFRLQHDGPDSVTIVVGPRDSQPNDPSAGQAPG